MNSKEQNKEGQNRLDGMIALPQPAIVGSCKSFQDEKQQCACEPYDKRPFDLSLPVSDLR
jgi:hypothetical protein